MGTLIARFEGHEGPVRGVDFHPTQPIFVSGGDDYTIKVWSLKTMKCMFTLTGHLDYVRTVFFHPTLPWIISASDDQTIRIWNWQSRKEIACLTGHNHYVMCAQFHPTKDLVVSASLDQTVRVWDISGLRKKQSAEAGNGMDAFSIDSLGGPGQRGSASMGLGGPQPPQQDVFGNTDCVVKYVLEGHDKGVNWASFHPTLPLIVSAGDDRAVKVWRMSETRAWEVDSCRGHTDNVLCALFDPEEQLIVSVGEDKTIRTWDLNTRTPVKQFRRESDRFWMIARHPNMKLFAACHDSGVMVFKLDRERPAWTEAGAGGRKGPQLVFVNSSFQLRSYDYRSGEISMPLASLKKLAAPWCKIRTVSYNAAENSVLIQSGEKDAGTYALVRLPREPVGAVDATARAQGSANAACFVGRNRYVTYTTSTSLLEVHDMSGNVTKSEALNGSKESPVDILEVRGSSGLVLLLYPGKVSLYDVQRRKEVAAVAVNNAKYASWSHDGKYVALLSKHTITIVTARKLEPVLSMHETIRVKSAAWDDTGVLLYTTLNHLKYALLNGDNGPVCTLSETVYLTRVSGDVCYNLTRRATVQQRKFDPTEYRFKRALVNGRSREVLRLMHSSKLVGENIVGYLEKRGYPEVALKFVSDSRTRFELALECHDVDRALEELEKISGEDKAEDAATVAAGYKRLATEALSQGRGQVAELCYQHLQALSRLSMLYVATGCRDRLHKMLPIAATRHDASSLLVNSIYSGDATLRAKVLAAAGLTPLAYAAACCGGLDDVAQTILKDAEKGSNKDIAKAAAKIQAATATAGPFAVPEPLIASEAGCRDFPLRPAPLSFFQRALSGEAGEVADEGEVEDEDGAKALTGSDMNVPELAEGETEGEGEADDLGEAWGDDLDDVSLDEAAPAGGAAVAKSDNKDETAPAVAKIPGELGAWVRNSRCAAGYIAAGAFEAAAQLLNRQAGVTTFEPLRPRFMQIYRASKLAFPAGDASGDPSVPTYVRQDPSGESEAQPLVPGLEELDPLLHEASKLFRANKLDAAIKEFRQVIYTVATIVVHTEEDDKKCTDALHMARDYIIALSIELARRALPTSDVKRNIELAILFARSPLKPAHKVNALQVAMTQCFKHHNYAMASYFAQQFLEIYSTGARAEKARKLKQRADSISTDAVDIGFDPYGEFDVCAATFKPIYANTPFVSDALTGAKYVPSQKGKLCNITLISTVGAQGSGLRILV